MRSDAAATGASGAALLAIGWSLSAGPAAAVVALVGVLVLAGALLRRRWPGGPTLVALAFLVELGLARDPNWAAVVLGTALLAGFLMISESYQTRLQRAGWSAAFRSHAVPLAAVVPAALAAVLATAVPLTGSAAQIGLAVAAAAGVVLLSVVISREEP